MLQMKEQKGLSITQKAEILYQLTLEGEKKNLFENLSALQLQELRNLLEQEILYLSELKEGSPLKLDEDIKSHYEPVSNYFHNNECSEPFEACEGETCFTFNSKCFSRKMHGNIEALLPLIESYLSKERSKNTEVPSPE
jgi:hypothetical protein